MNILVKSISVIGFALVSLLSSTFVKAETVHLTSLSWPPYSDRGLDQQGASVAVAQAAFQAMGHELIVDFFPWSRAVAFASEPGGKYAGYFPEYYYETNDFVFSESMGTGPLGLVENVNNPITWRSVDDLEQYTLGVVQDYVNTEELDAKIASGDINAQAVVADDRNVLKVAAGRIDAAVIDANVLSYLLENEPSLRSAVGQVQMNANLLVDKKLFIAFRNDADGNRWRNIFNEGLEKIDVDAIMQEYLNQ
ncbi:MAG: ABC-type uptake system substrate-binding component [Idiomarinaceae bacterium HL-53]|nr:MAG: ABC-type uptake system substrate-binding component [Idiomarinaceae bacterium HL-53]CUS49479.1 ABC-type amino acid transport substrate-binding protein [Idiomarinaceae bacterium HL-53]